VTPRKTKSPGAAKSTRHKAPPETTSTTEVHAVSGNGPPDVGTTLRRLRRDRELSLEQLAQASGVSRAMLGQIELGQSTPTVTVVWKIAGALGVPFTALLGEPETTKQVLRAADAKWMRSRDGKYQSRALFIPGPQGLMEFYELKLQAGATQEFPPHGPGTTESVVVTEGGLNITLGDETITLGCGDALTYAADRRHTYHAATDRDVVLHCVITYQTRSG
jgi:transcriptional regulator with XRE-family HTH domain